MHFHIRMAALDDVPVIDEIYRQGTLDLTATSDLSAYLPPDMTQWLLERSPSEPVLVLESDGELNGWAALSAHSSRAAYSHVKNLSIYVRRDQRAKGLGTALLHALLVKATAAGVRKVVLTAFPFNESGLSLYTKLGFRMVGMYERHGHVKGEWVDVVIMEKILSASVTGDEGLTHGEDD